MTATIEANEQIVRWQAVAQVCSELLAGSTGSTGSPTADAPVGEEAA